MDEIFRYHVKPELKCVLENVDVDGSPRLYYTEGRTVNPGHDIEGAWFLQIGRASCRERVEVIV